ncbi:hypothetical protein OKC48_16500 [Methylorubrum extorquens]|uniref:hypothetical protein n=1 Tax=Methylorubrum extorquens TaxID=408 RepID=UPI0022371D49|nr:hypothetical protein [Methylorubrum extorquens]UYW24873.1 hypothetical protein OKC48_16500 [Methylorubrum extorquens]
MLGQRIDAVVATAGSALAGVTSEQTARVNADNALAELVQAVQAQTDAGTAQGRIKFEAVSAPTGVAARFSIMLATERNGVYRYSGFFMDILPDGTSRTVIDANVFALTGDGGLTYPFIVQNGIVTIRDLRVTQTAILPGAVNDRVSLVGEDLDPGAFSSGWREVPGTGFTVTPDDVWSILFSGTAILTATANGNANLITTTRLEVVLGLDGQPYTPASFAVANATAGGGGAPSVTVNTPITSGAAAFEILPSGLSRRVALLYKFTGTAGSGRINYGQLKALVTKR